VAGHVIRDSDASILARNKRQTPISIVVSPITAKEGEQAEIAVGVFRDISKEKAEEAQRSDFISTASHEMRTPVAAIEGYLSLAMNDKIAKIDSNARNYMIKALDSTHHLGQLFQDLLTSSKAEDGRLQSNPVVVEMGEIVQEITEASRFKASERRLSLNFVVSSDKEISGGKIVRPFYYSFVDPTRMAEVLQNLIDNAIKYTPEGSIQVRLTGDAQTVQIQIQDTGGGIPTEDIPHLFQKFYRVDSSATRTVGGTGLGLFICRKIVELYNGKIWVESQLGKGSTFFINLPRLTSEQALDIQKRQASIVSPSEII
jgi:two-component system, OmpR family, sensor histidine kinase VicK